MGILITIGINVFLLTATGGCVVLINNSLYELDELYEDRADLNIEEERIWEKLEKEGEKEGEENEK